MHLHLVTLHTHPSPQAVPLAAACLKAWLDARPGGATVTLADTYLTTPPEDITAAILAAHPDVVGFPLYSWNRDICCTVAAALRRAAPQMILLGGGPEATADPAGVLAAAPFDAVIIGEGEETLGELLDRHAAGQSLAGLAGVAQRIDGNVVVSKRSARSDPGTFPSPILSGCLDPYIPIGILWQLSRGCSYGCDFCFDGLGERRVRRIGEERLALELDYLVSHGVGQIFVLDSTFNQDGARAKRLLRRLKEKAPHVHCHFEIRHELLDAEQVRLFAALPCSLQIGLQSASPDILRQVGRTFDCATFRSKIGLLNSAGVTFGFDLIAGLPGDSLAEFRASLDFALALYPNQLDIFPLAVLPGTALAARADELQLRHLSNPPYTLLASPTFGEGDLAIAGRLGAACDIFYSRGRAVAWFNAVVEALNLTPAAFLQRFADWLQQRQGDALRPEEYDHPRIWQWQRDFLTAQFATPKLQRLLPLALDLVDYHYHYAAALLAPPAPTLSQRDVARLDPLRQPLRLAESTRLARFHYPILDLLEAGEPRLRRFAAAVAPEPSCAVLFPHGGAIHTEALDEVYFRLLERLDGQTPATRLAQALKLPAAAADEFLRFALAQGIVVRA